MKTSIVFLAFCCFFPLFLQAQVQPQFKFYLAFEDAKHEKDTVWIVMDTLASNGMDTIFGEDTTILDSGAFQVFFGNPNTWYTKMRAINPGNLTTFIRAQNYQLPITIRWDTNLLKNHTLPFELKQATLFNDYTWGVCPGYICCQRYKHLIDTSIYCPGIGRTDSLIFPAGMPNYYFFPIEVYLAKTPFARPHGIDETAHNNLFKLTPNPATSSVVIQSTNKSYLQNIEVMMFDIGGRLVLQSEQHKIDVSHLKRGNYIVQINYLNHLSYEKLIIMH